MNLKTYKLAELLTQYRETHFVENDQDYKQLTISKYSGVSYRGTKNGKLIGRKRQFIVNLRKYPHTLLFTRQGVKDGSIGIAPKDVDGCIATENMPMFSINTNIILPELLASWLNSEECKTQIDSITPTGSAQKAIHERDLLKILVSIPVNIEDQKKLINVLNNQKNVIEYLNSENQNQSSYITKLRQAILQEAIEGKLTADWRKENPVRKGDPDFDAEALLEKIQAEKEKLIKEGKIKKQKPLAPIKAEEVPFELPEGWVWTRLGEVTELITKGSSPNWQGVPYVEKGKGIRFITSKNVGFYKIDFTDETFVDKRFNQIEPRSVLKNGDILTNIVGASIGRTAIYDLDDNANINQAVCILRYTHKYVIKLFFLHWMNSPIVINKMHEDEFAPGRANLSMLNVASFLFALPPLAEQQVIVDRVENLLSMVDELDKQISERKEQSEQLMQAVLREAFEGGK